MVEAKNKNRNNYVYGNTAYELEPVTKPRVPQKTKKNVKNKNKHKFRLIGKIVAVFVLSFLLVSRFTVVMKLTYDIRAAKTEIANTIDSNENTSILLAEKSNINDIEKIAVEKEGMISPVQSQIMYVNVKPLTVSTEKYSQNEIKSIQRLLGLIN